MITSVGAGVDGPGTCIWKPINKWSTVLGAEIHAIFIRAMLNIGKRLIIHSRAAALYIYFFLNARNVHRRRRLKPKVCFGVLFRIAF